MSDNVWSSTGNTDANAGANWSLGHVPTTGETAVWDGTSVVNCTLSADFSPSSINVLTSYTGTILLGSYAVSGGDMTWNIGTGGTINFGSSTITCSGNFDWSGATGTITEGTSQLVLTGVSKTLTTPSTKGALYKLTLNAGSDYTASLGTASLILNSLFTLNGSLTFNTSGSFYAQLGMTQGANGAMSGTGTLFLYAGTMTFANSAALTCATILVRRSVVLPVGTYAPTTLLDIWSGTSGDATFAWQAGTYTFACPVRIRRDGATGTFTISGTNNPTLIFQQSVTVTQTTGTITFTNNSTNPNQLTGTSNQTINLAGKNMGTWVVNKPASGVITWTSGDTITAGGAWSMTSLTQPAGVTMDMADGGYVHTFSGDVTLAGAFDMGTSTVRCGGNFSNKDATSWTAGTGTVSVYGANNTLTLKDVSIYAVTIEAGAKYSKGTGGYEYIQAGTLTLNGEAAHSVWCASTGRVVFSASGKASGTWLVLAASQTGYGITAFPVGATITVGTLWLRATASGQALPPGTYSPTTFLVSNSTAVSCTWTPGNGSYVVTGNMSVTNDNASATTTINNSANSPNISVAGNLTLTQSAGTLTYTAGSGTITLTGGNSTITSLGKSLEGIVVNKTATASTLTLGDSLNCASFTMTQGTLVPSGKSITATGAITIGTAGQVSAATLAGATWTAASFVGTGIPGTPLLLNPASGWTLTVSGSNRVNSSTIAQCNAGGGATLVARGSTNGGNNTNVTFSNRLRSQFAAVPYANASRDFADSIVWGVV